MDENSFVENLRAIAKDELVITRHGSEIEDYQRKQFLAVKSRLSEIHSKTPDLLDRLNSGIVIVPDNITHTEMEKVGISSQFCLSFIQDVPGLWDEGEDPLREIVTRFLDLTNTQVQNACRQFEVAEAEKHDTMILNQFTQKYTQFIEDSMEDIIARHALISKEVVEAAKNAENARTASANAVLASKNAIIASSEANKIVKRTKSSAQSAIKTAENAEKTADNMIPNMLTVLSIFVGIIIAVVACYLSVLLSAEDVKTISDISIPLAFMMVWLMGHIILMVTFLLLYLTSKLTGKSLACHCKEINLSSSGRSNYSKNVSRTFECSQCVYSKDCNVLAQLKSRFPYIYWINVVFMIGYLVLTVVHLVDLYYAEWLHTLINANWGSFIGFLILAILIIVGSVVVTVFISKRRKSK
ncbi:MAG: hypothetical protein IJW45_07880 [Oscillospiraceae bacterium]|nr:hypothetical protein [Oscillospiraceae bacterium]